MNSERIRHLLDQIYKASDELRDELKPYEEIWTAVDGAKPLAEMGLSEKCKVAQALLRRMPTVRPILGKDC